MIASEIFELLKRHKMTLTIYPCGSWNLSYGNNEYISGAYLCDLSTKYVEYAMRARLIESKIPEQGVW